MAYSFASNSAKLRATSFLQPASAGTIALWLKPGWSSGDSVIHCFWYIGDSGTVSLAFQRYSDNNIYIGWDTATDQRITIADTAIFSNGTLASHIFTWDDAADDQKYYVNGTQKGSRTTTLTVDTLGAEYTVGNYPSAIEGAGASANGDMAEYAEWTAALDAAERAAFDRGVSPRLIRPSALQVHLPLVRVNQDIINGTAFTATNTSVTDHPRIIYPRGRQARKMTTVVTLVYMRPDADDADGTWTTETGGTTLFASIDEPAVDDADYIKSAETPQNDIARVRISDPTSTPADPFKVRYRYKKTGGDTVDLIVRLKQSTTLIKAWTHSDVGTDFTTVTQTLSAGEFASITDFSDLFVEFEADTP